MSSINFDLPASQVAETEQASQVAQPVAVAVQAAAPDINSLDMYNVVDEIDPEASIYDKALPPVDGWHPIKVTAVKDGIAEDARKPIAGLPAYLPDNFNGSVGWFTFTDQDGTSQLHFQIVVDHQIVEPGAQGSGQTSREWLNTMVMNVNERPISAVDTYLNRLTGKSGQGLTRLAKIQALYQALVTEPMVNGQTRWFLQGVDAIPVMDKAGAQKFTQKGKEKKEFPIFFRGMKAFPEVLDAEGKGTGRRLALEELSKDATVRGKTYPAGTPARTKWEVIDMKPLSAPVPK